MLVHEVAARGDLVLIIRLLRNKPSLLNIKDQYGQTPLLWAASYGQFEMVLYLLALGADVKAITESKSDTPEYGRDAYAWALTRGNHPICASVIKSYYDIQGQLGYHAIHEMAYFGKLNAIHAILEREPDLLNRIYNGKSPLTYAVMTGQIDTVLYLMARGARAGQDLIQIASESKQQQVINATALYLRKDHPIHIAAEYGRLQAIRVILEYNPRLLEQRDVYSQTPLLWAVSRGHLSIALYLLQLGANLNIETIRQNSRHHHWSIIRWAEYSGNRQLLTILKEYSTQKVTRAVHIVAEYGDLAALHALMQTQPDLLDAKDKFLQTPLLWSASKGQFNCTVFLLGLGASLDAKTTLSDKGARHHGQSIDMWAKNSGQQEVIDIVEQAADQKNKTNPLHKAAASGRLQLVIALLSINPHLLEVQDKYQQTALLMAASVNEIDVTLYLLAKGASVEAKTYFPGAMANNRSVLGWCKQQENTLPYDALKDYDDASRRMQRPFKHPVHYAAEFGREQLVRVFLEENSEYLNLEDRIGQTPLIWAAANGRDIIVTLLIQLNAGLNYKTSNSSNNHDGWTALHWAVARQHRNIVKMLIKAGANTEGCELLASGHVSLLALLRVTAYIRIRQQQPEYKKTITIRSRVFNFGCSRTDKIKAAKAFQSNLLESAPSKITDPEDLNQLTEWFSDLRAIYKPWHDTQRP